LKKERQQYRDQYKKRRLERQLFLPQSIKSDNKMGINREKSNIAFAILENLAFW